ncbi:conserved Plasmodium protein, unknown function [Plasmodium yoelii]|uniref:Phosphoinositide-binding protein PH2 n=2 Tax=Plasmodium yoelii TaxID=5861 RepID=A0AAF0B2R6_PLAYO|nr:conserved Plasmodium protein, unknown function [Plasmodium yoelii]WBY60297.1 phosphoinositide-binding protein PH2 [Plasmodium yoelii yoelii]CDU20181.1 conserved Plasmodium protein, unknown function [Plasmodium yoelii]VTZ80939.1 conserved Plasmodium protein, unknown function [Plasmodium yoelii]|eukprot:XP_022813716.1 conserved Plasmodium protein, unknown function [Plasmodium yoelii]
MFDTTSLIHLGSNQTIQKSISGELCMYICKKKINKEYSPFFFPENDNKINENIYTNINYNDKLKQSYKWEKYFCFIKANFFFVYKFKGDYKPQFVFLLEGIQVQTINYNVAIKNGIIEKVDNFNIGENEDIIQIKFIPSLNNMNMCIFYASKVGYSKRWAQILTDSNFTLLNKNLNIIKDENEEIKNDIKNIKKINKIEIKNKDIQINSLNDRINMLKADIENVRIKNKRLQTAAEANIQSADEFLQKKMTEMSAICAEIESKIEENETLKDKIKAAAREFEKMEKERNDANNEKFNLENKIKDIIVTYEEAKSDPEKITLKNFNINQRYQEIVVHNQNLKTEIKKLIERYYELENKYKEKIKTIKEIIEIGDIFDYLHKLVILCQTKIKFYEQSYKYTDEQQNELLTHLEYIIKETKLAEANARVSYITHRSKILEERLLYYINRKAPSDYFYFANITLRRLGWIFGEIETLNPIHLINCKNEKNKSIQQNDDVYPLYSYLDENNANIIPMREQIYYNEGIEGRECFKIVTDVDVYSTPIKMYPYENMLLIENKYNYIKIKLTDLKKDFNILKQKKKFETKSTISDLQWSEITKNAYHRLEKNIIALDQKNV